MALLNKFLKRTSFEQDSTIPLNILICFSKKKTGIALSKIASYLMQSKIKDEQIASLHLVEKEEFDRIENIDEYKASLYEGIIEECKKNTSMVRTFVKPADDFVEEILSTSNNLGCNLVLIGIGKSVFSPKIWGTYQEFKVHQGENQEEEQTTETISYKGVSSLLERNEETTGVFIEHNLEDINNVFIPVLDKEDIHIFEYLKRISENTEAKIILWDAIGIIDLIPELKKGFNTIQKNTKGEVSLWDNSKKIDYDYITQQDLVIIGLESWTKLINSAITWNHSLPSTLIIRNKTDD